MLPNLSNLKEPSTPPRPKKVRKVAQQDNPGQSSSGDDGAGGGGDNDDNDDNDDGALTPLASWQKERGMLDPVMDEDPSTPLDNFTKNELYEEALREAMRRKERDPRGYEEEQRSRRPHLRRSPIPRALDPSEEM